jgi:gamma-glutamyltranspeptidase/glutathione hydrolase
MRPETAGPRGAVATTHWLATQAGMAMLDRGGNAFDAAAAAAFVQQVVEPHLNGPGGDVPIMVHRPGEGVRVICGQGPMPAAATRDRFQDLGLDSVPGSGLLPACVPGAVGAWLRLLSEYGTLRLGEVLAPALHYAEYGHPVLPKAAEMIAALAPLFRTEWAESGRTYLPNGEPPAPHSRLRNPALATTYRRLVDEAGDNGTREAQIERAITAFYAGFVAEAIDKYLATAEVADATGRRNGGLLTGDDLANWRAGVEDPVSLGYRGLEVHKPGPWSQGPVFLQQLALLGPLDLASAGRGSADHVHTVVEVAKLAFADREAWYGDPAHANVPLEALLSPAYSDDRRALLGTEASGVLRAGAPEGRVPWIPEATGEPLAARDPSWLTQLDDGIPAVVRLTQASGDTCCVSAADATGNMVVATPSGGWLKSSPVIPGLGFPLGTRGQMAWLLDGHPNSLAPGKRPRTTLSPTLVLRDGRAHLAFGTPGGDQQDQWTLNFFLNHVDFGLSPQAAVEAITFHTDHPPSSFIPRRARPLALVTEPGLDPAVLRELRRRGHEIDLVAPYSLGKVCATAFTTDGLVQAAASPRGQQAHAAAL